MTVRDLVDDTEAVAYISDQLRQARARKGITGSRVADAAGTSHATYYNFESHPLRFSFKPSTIVDICNVLEIDAYDILFRMQRLHPDMEAALFGNRALYDAVANAVKGSS